MTVFGRFLKHIGGKQPSVPQPGQPAPSPLVDVPDSDFVTVVEQSSQLVVIDFWAEWCEPCHIMSAYVGFLARQYVGRVLVAALDVDENPDTPAHFKVMGLPTLLMLRKGQEVDRIVGVIPYEEIKARVEYLLVSE